MAISSRYSILITGGAGFIGSHFCDRMLQKGHRVICADNLSTGAFTNIQPLLNHPRFRFVEHDIREPLRISEPLQRIYNFACPASPQHYQRDPVATLQTCVIGAFNVLELARAKRARALQASTSEVYGDPEVHPQPESYWGHVNPIGPRACYDEGKRCAETMFFNYGAQHRVIIKVARIFNTYGPRMLENDGRVVSNFITQALLGLPLTIYGDGRQTRSLCYVDDMLNGLERLMESPDKITGPFNLGNPCETTISDIAKLVLEQTRSRSRLTHLPLPTDDPKRRKPVIQQAIDALRWSPRVALEDGLRATIDYFTLRLFTPAAKDVAREKLETDYRASDALIA